MRSPASEDYYRGLAAKHHAYYGPRGFCGVRRAAYW